MPDLSGADKSRADLSPNLDAPVYSRPRPALPLLPDPEVPMPLPLAPLIPLALRLGAFATAGYAATRWARARTRTGRTDQRAEDALDDIGEGIAIHRPVDRAGQRAGDTQTNAAARVVRVIRFGGKTWEVDAGLMARLRLRQRPE